YVLVDNSGLVPVTVQSVASAAPYLASLELSGGQVLAKVTFAPSVAGVATGTVSVATDNGTGTVSVIGTGVNPGGRVSPQFTTAAPALAVVGKQFVYVAKASDPAGGGLTFAIPSAPQGATIHPTGGILRWTPSSSQAGVFEVTITATDVNGQVATQT